MKRKSLLMLLLLALGLPWAAMGQKTLPYEYGFENNDLESEGWTKQQCTNNTGIYTDAKCTGTYGFRFFYNTNPPQYLVSPELTGCPYGVEMAFSYKASYFQQNETFQLGYSSTTNDVDSFVFGETIQPSTTTWSSLSQSFPAGTKYVAVKYTANNQYYLYLDDFSFTALPSCPTPINLHVTLTEGNGTTATLSWLEKGSATEWVMQCGTDSSFDNGTYTEYAVTGTPSKTLTDLTPETPYFVRVKSDCGAGDQSEWSNVCGFKPSNAISMIVNDGTASNYNVPLCQPYGDGSQFIIPASSLGAITYGQITKLSFYAASTSVFPWGTATYNVYLTETPDSYFSGNVKYPYEAMTKVYTGTFSVSNSLMTIDLNTPYYYEGDNLLVAIEDDNSVSSYGNFYWYGVTTTNNQALSGMAGNTLVKFLPKTKISYLEGVAPAHPRPKYFETTSITSFSATFTWTNGGSETAWQIAYTDDEDADPNDIPATNVVDVTAKPYTLSGLSGGTEYFAYIRAVAGSEHSDWSQVCSFTPSCNSPYNFGPNYLTFNSARLTWANGGTESEWQIVYSTDKDFDPDLAEPIDVNQKPYTLTGLSTDVTYYAHIRAKCDVDDYSSWSEKCQFTPSCIKASNLNATILGPTSAELKWSPGGNQSGWQIAYTDNAETLPDDATIVNVSAYPPYTLTGLTTDVTYYAYVRSDCGTDHYSDWSTVCSFTPTYLLTVNNGTSTNANVPVKGLYVDDYSRSQFIIPAISLESIAYSTINKLVFYCANTNVNWGTAEFDVCMKETTKTDFEAASLDWTDMETVYSGSLSVANGMMEIQFVEGFSYLDGNLLIGIKETKTGTARSSYWYGVNTNSNTAVGGYETTRGLALYQFLPKTSLYYTPGAAPTCIKPTGLSITESSNSAVLTWTAGADETHWNVQYKAASATDWNALVAVENTPEYLITGLTPATSYRVRVQSDCGGGDVSGWVTGGFATECGAFDLPYEHDFDHDTPGATSGLPRCWTRINDSESATYQNYPRILADETGQMHSHSSSNYMMFYSLGDYTALNQIAVLPEMEADVSTLVLSFYAKLETGQTNQKLAIGVMTDPEDASTFVKYKDVKIASSTYAQYTVDFGDCSSSGLYIAIKCERGASTRYFVDDISISQSCREPKNLGIADVTSNSAVLTWTSANVGTDWQVQYKKSSDADWSESIAVSGTASHTFNNLTAATDYEVRVRTVCGEANYSDWVSTTFTTECNYMSLPYSHNFENDEVGVIAPACWHFHGSYYPRIDDDPYNYGHAHSGQNCLMIYQNSDNAANYVVLPEINTAETPINTLQVTFWGKRFGNEVYQYYSFDNLYLGVMTDPNDVSTFQYVSGAYTNIANLDEYKFFELYLDNYSGEGTYLAIRYNGSPLYYIDDIEVSVAPTCRQPLDLSTQYTNAHEAEIRWKTRDLRQCNYQVSYSTDATFNPEDGTIVDVEFENTLVNAGTDYRDYYLTCLNANTTYYYYVRANCGNGDFSEWSDDYASFTTQEACPEPEDFGAYTVKNTYAILQWLGDLNANWEFRYKKISDEEWITPANLELLSGEGSELRYRIDNLETNVEYIAQLRRHCGVYSCPTVDDGYSDWVTYTFITSEGCQTPSAWMCLTQMGTSAKLEWNQLGEENYWQIRYRLSTENDYPAENITLTDYMPEAKKQQWTITGLQTNSMYYWQVRAYCDSESQSQWSNERYFFTGGEKVTVDKAHPFYEDFESSTGMPDGWMRCNQYNYDLNYFMPWSYTPAEGPSWDERPDNHGIYNNHSDFHGSTSVILPEMHIDENAHTTMFSFWDYCDYGPSAISGQNISYGSMQIMASTNHGETYDYLWWSFGPHRYWHQHFVDLDEYIGQDVIIRIDYWYANNNPNFDWYIDDVKVQVFDNSFGSGSGITSGDWNDPAMWGNGSAPGDDDDVIINANVTIPEGVVAQANNIVINTDTIQTGGRADKFGKLIIANGGQLKVNNEVRTTVQKAIKGYTRGGDNWYLVAAPVKETLSPTSDDVTDVIQGNYDLYSFDGGYEDAEWRNYKQHQNDFVFRNGYGYLMANSAEVTPSFTGTVLPSNRNKMVAIAYDATTFGAWNLVGNPFTCDAYFQDGRNFYRMNSEGSALISASGVIHPMEGVFVEATGENQQVTFTTAAPQPDGSNHGALLFSLSKNRGAEADRASIRFGEGRNLGKFSLMASPDQLYIPQNGKDYAVVYAMPMGEMPLNFKADSNGTFCISVSTEDVNVNYLHLIDNLTGNDVDLMKTPYYTFDARPSDYASRFKVVFATSSAFENDDFAFVYNGEIIVNGEGTLQVVDMLGHILVSRLVNSDSCLLTSDSLSKGVYVLRLINGDQVRTQKIIVK